jgi:predicted NBD/HSP70 family sugar kinase/DNA-binding transcriptional ArsR family regulator
VPDDHRRAGAAAAGRGPGPAGSPTFLKELNRRAVFDALRRTAQSRSQLAASTGLSKPTVSSALDHLQRAGLVRRNGSAAGRAGPAAALYEPDPTAGFVVGIQLSGRVQVAVAALDGTVLARGTAANRARTPTTLAAAVTGLAHDAVHGAGLRFGDASAVVVATPGVPDPATRSVARAVLPGIDRPGFLDELDTALGTACTVENDVNLAAVGEHRFGAAQGVSDFVLVSLRPGLGMSAFVGGRLHRGVHGAAGEVAVIPLVAAHPLDALVRLAAGTPGEELMREEAVSSAGLVRLAHRLGRPELRGPRDVYRAARAGDRVARRAVRVHARQLALTVAAAGAVLDPELVVISGTLDDDVCAQVRKALGAVGALPPAFVLGHLGDQAVLLGAIAAALPPAFERVLARGLRYRVEPTG